MLYQYVLRDLSQVVNIREYYDKCSNSIIIPIKEYEKSRSIQKDVRYLLESTTLEPFGGFWHLWVSRLENVGLCICIGTMFNCSGRLG